MKVLTVPCIAFIFLGVVYAGNAFTQQVFKCLNAAGKVEFSDALCAGDRSIQKIKAQNNVIDGSSAREYLLRNENEELKQKLIEQQRNLSSGATAAQRTQPDLQAERIDTLACERAKRDYDVTANSKFNSAEIVEARRSIMFGTCGMREPTKNTTTIDTRINVTR